MLRRKVTARVRSRLFGGELCFAEFSWRPLPTRNRNVVGKNKVLIPFVLELFFVVLEEKGLFLSVLFCRMRGYVNAAWTSVTSHHWPLSL